MYLLQHETRVEEYCSSLSELVGCLRKLFNKWEEHQDIQQSHSTSLSHQAPLQSPVAVVRRPWFEITKDQLSYYCHYLLSVQKLLLCLVLAG